MKKVFFLASMFLCLACMQLSAQTPSADDIVKNYLKNIGGAENWKNLKSMKISGKMGMQGMEFPMTIYRMPESMQRLELNVQGKDIIQAYDGKDAWMINPLMGANEPQIIPEEVAKEMKKEKFEDVLIDYKKKGHTVEFLGKEAVNGAETLKVKLTLKTGEVKTYFFDAKKYMPVMVSITTSIGPGQEVVTETHMSNYQAVNGFVIPHKIEVRQNGQVAQTLTVDATTFNEKFDAAIFAMPAKQ